MVPGLIRSLHLGALVFLSIASTASALSYQPHTENYLVPVTRISSYCSSYPCYYRCYYCGWWCGRRCRYTDTCRHCTITYRTEQVTKTRCQANWSGPDCNIPTCSRPCSEGQSCVPDNKCECLGQGSGVCGAVPCPTRSCYPGSCSSGSCNCPPQFVGENCERIQQTPEISDCQVKLFTGTPEREVAQANCAVEGHDPELTWVGVNTFSRIEARWEATYTNPFKPVLPTKTSHIEDARFGVTYTNARVSVSRSSGNPIERQVRPECKGNNLDPNENVKCPSKTIRWSEFGIRELNENQTITVEVSAQLGGYKKLRSTGATEEISGAGSVINRKALFAVDAKPPVHCRQTASCKDPAIYLKQDAVTNAVIEGEFSNWIDGQSGIHRYHAKIYRLLKSSGDVLQTPQRPENEFNVNTSNKFTYTFPSPGVFSIELTVYDRAQNPSRARKIVLYDNNNHMTTTKEPFIVNQASKESGYKWITSALGEETDGNSRLTVSWKGRYANQFHVSEGWLYRIETKQDVIDDDLVDEGGNRTIHAVKHSNGTVGYRLAFKVYKHGRAGLKPGVDFGENNSSTIRELAESTWGGYSHDATSTTLVMPQLTSNDTIVIWMQAYDVVGNDIEDRIQIGFDTSAPEIDTDAPAVLKPNPNDQYKSSVEIKVHDMQSGIAEVQYWITVSYQATNITSGTAKVTKLRSENNRRKRALAICKSGSSDCYCVRGGECFEYIIRVDINHCDIDRHYKADQPMTFFYVVMNQAGQSAVPRQPLIMKFEAEPKCRPIPVFTAGTLLAIAVGCLILIALIVIAIFMVMRWKQDKHPIPDRVRTFATSMRQRVTNTEKVLSSDGHAIYRAKTRRGKVDEEDDDIYVDGRDPGGWRVNRDQVEMIETLAEGRFATVKKAYLKKGGETKCVAAKYLPAGASDSDKALLRAKIAFHGNRVPPHENIVRLVGVVDEGPIMLLEFCDLTLKAWLSNVGKVTADALENMLNFTTHIASGMEFLHSKNILHRRLAMRNVLLKKEGVDGLVAKLIGFGSFNESGTDDQAEESAATAVPLKWLAPETLESVGKGKVVYTQKSDVWAYGVTIWEIYSLGATPYAGKKSADVEALLKTGHRMPRPEECPPELFDSVVTPSWNVAAKKRPDFKTLCKSIRSFRSGGGDQQEGYYTADLTRKTYDNPKERSNDYTAGRAGKSAAKPDSIYDDTRK